MRRVSLYKKRWRDLTPRQKLLRERSLEVLSESRRSKKSVSKIAKENKISLKAVVNNTNGFKKKNRKLIPKKFDRISRGMIINENGKEISIEINDSRLASIIGNYHNVVKEFLSTGNTKKLKRFSKIKIRDSDKNIHSFETDPDEIIKINEKVEEPEFFEVYDN